MQPFVYHVNEIGETYPSDISRYWTHSAKVTVWAKEESPAMKSMVAREGAKTCRNFKGQPKGVHPITIVYDKDVPTLSLYPTDTAFCSALLRQGVACMYTG